MKDPKKHRCKRRECGRTYVIGRGLSDETYCSGTCRMFESSAHKALVAERRRASAATAKARAANLAKARKARRNRMAVAV